MLNYAHLEMLCNICFALFTLSWLVTRHGLYFFIVRSIVYTEIDLKWDPENQYYFSATVRNGYLVGFAILQILLIFWFYLILKIIYNIVFVKQKSADIRSSDDENELVDSKSSKVVAKDKKKQ